MCSSASSSHDSSPPESDDDTYMDSSNTFPSEGDTSAMTSRLRPRLSLRASVSSEQNGFITTVPQQYTEFGSLIAGELHLTKWALSEGFFLTVSRKTSTFCYLRCFQYKDTEDPCSYQLKVDIIQGTERFRLHVIEDRHNHPPDNTPGESPAAPSNRSMYTASPSSALVAPLATQARSCGDSNNGQQGSRWQCAAVQYHVPVPQEYLVPFQTAEQAQLMLTRWSMDEGYLLKGGGGYASYHYLRCNRYNTGPLPYCQYSIRLGPAENSSGWEIDTMSDVHNHPSSLPVRQPAAASITAPVTQSSTASDTVLPSSTPTPQPRDQQQSASVNPVPVLAASPTPRVKISLKRSSADPQNSSSAAIVPSPAPLTSSALTELHNKTSVPAQRGLSSTNVTSGPTVYPLPSRSNSDQPAGHTSSTNISVAVASSSTRVPSPSTVHKTADSPEQASADQRMQVPDGTSEPLAKRARTDSADEPTSHVTAEGDPTPEGGAVQQDGNPSCDLVRAILNIPQKEFFNDILQLSELELHQYRLRNDEINKRLKKRLKK